MNADANKQMRKVSKLRGPELLLKNMSLLGTDPVTVERTVRSRISATLERTAESLLEAALRRGVWS